MKFQRILSVFLMLALLFCGAAFAASAEGASPFGFTVDKSAPEVGDTFTVTVTLAVDGAKAMILIPEYDKSVLEIVEGEWADAITDEAMLSMGWTPAAPDAVVAFDEAVTVSGEVFTMTFRVLAEGSTKIGVGAVVKADDENILGEEDLPCSSIDDYNSYAAITVGPGVAPEVTTPVTTAPETTEPEPEVTTPVTTAPETTVPETTAPETTVPEDTTPDSTKPEDTTPESTTPDTEPDETEPDETQPTEPTEPKKPLNLGLIVGVSAAAIVAVVLTCVLVFRRRY